MNGSNFFIIATEEHSDVKSSRKSTLLGVASVAPISIGIRMKLIIKKNTRRNNHRSQVLRVLL